MTSGRDALSAPFHAVAISGRPCRVPVTVSVSIHWKNWSPSGVPLAAYRLKRSKHHEEIIPFTDAARVAGADAGTVLIYPQAWSSVCRCTGDSGDGYLCGCRWCRRVCHGVCAGTLRAGAAAGIAGREDCHVAVLQPVPWRRRAAALVVMVATFISLVAAGWILLR